MRYINKRLRRDLITFVAGMTVIADLACMAIAEIFGRHPERASRNEIERTRIDLQRMHASIEKYGYITNRYWE